MIELFKIMNVKICEKWKFILRGCYCIAALVHDAENKVNGNLIKTNKTHLYIEFIKIIYILKISKKLFGNNNNNTKKNNNYKLKIISE